MPIYEYKCKKCGNVFSKLVFGQNPKIECEKCGSEDVEKLISTISSSSGGTSGSCGGGTTGFT